MSPLLDLFSRAGSSRGAAQSAAARKAAAKKAAAERAVVKRAAAQRAAAKRLAAKRAADKRAADRKAAATKGGVTKPPAAPKLPGPPPPAAQPPVAAPPGPVLPPYSPTPVPVASTSVTIFPSATAAMNGAAKTAVAPFAWDPASHLLSRFAFGPDLAARKQVTEHGPDAWWDAQVALGSSLSGYAGNAAVAAQGPLLSQTPAQVRAWLKSNGNEYGWTLMDQLSRVTIGLQTWSSAQLYETVVDFFANHLNVANHSDSVWSSRHTMDRDVIRAHAFGSFTDMLLASAKNPAMLQYLNLAQSTKTQINENYGRELLELHTVGVGNYSEDDVKNSAKILTGRTTDSNYGYVYNAGRHWLGAITVMGFSHPNSTAAAGETAGDAYLSYLAAHPLTAQHLAKKLCVRFVSDTPSIALVNAVAKAYTDTGTQILPMLQTIVRSDEFWSNRGAKIRRPAENLIATVRILGNEASDLGKALADLHWMSSAVANVPLDWGPPNGYPDYAGAWRSSGSILQAWQYHRGFTQGWWDGFVKLDPTTLYGPVAPTTSGQAIDLLTNRLTNMTFSPAHRTLLQAFLKEPGSTPIAKSNLRWYLAHLIPLILDGPHHANR